MWRRLDDDKSRRKLKDLRVSGRQIVYVHIPDSVDVSKVLDSHVSGVPPRACGSMILDILFLRVARSSRGEKRRKRMRRNLH